VAAAVPGVPAPGPVTNGDRLGATIVLAALVHAMVVFGIGFTPRPLDEPRYDSLEVILVSRRDEKAPEDAELAAQANLEGGGDATETERPSAPLDAPFPDSKAEVAMPAENVAPPTPPAPDPAPPAPARPAAAPDPARAATNDKPVLAKSSEAPTPDAVPERVKETTKTDVDAPEPRDTRERPSAAELIASSMEMASLNAELEQRLDALAKRPRRKYISASTKEYKYAAYLESWRAKVERVGNLNYPDAAREAGLSGSLLLDVALNQDGSVREITIRRSSGHAVLDEAAVKIVELAAPYAPLPPNIRKEVDILHITRTWQFLNNARFSAN